LNLKRHQALDRINAELRDEFEELAAPDFVARTSCHTRVWRLRRRSAVSRERQAAS
jgi:hypothetical protein